MERPEVIINGWAILVSALVYFIIGAVWFSEKAFGRTWAEGAGIESSKKGLMKKFGLNFLGALVVAFVMSHFISYTSYFMGVGGIVGGIQTAFWAWLGFSGATYLMNFVFEDKPFKFYLVNTGYHLAGLIASGIILGIWR
ncbi:MAG: DUF1761 domain-containing protein [FCB group bacterium]|nr:DUF1761 domain-containing protein [FCB group bacterium]